MFGEDERNGHENDSHHGSRDADRHKLAPGTTAPRHTHPGEEIIYVLDGTWEYTVQGKPPVTLEAGDVLFIPAGTIHSARNVGDGRAAELATYIVEKGKALMPVVAW